jgi:excisionase family DNA binding protein
MDRELGFDEVRDKPLTVEDLLQVLFRAQAGTCAWPWGTNLPPPLGVKPFPWPWSGIPMPPLGVRPKEAARVIGASRSQLYRLLREGKLRAVKRGVTLLVLTDSIYEHMASLPPATFGAPSPVDTDQT